MSASSSTVARRAAGQLGPSFRSRTRFPARSPHSICAAHLLHTSRLNPALIVFASARYSTERNVQSREDGTTGTPAPPPGFAAATAKSPLRDQKAARVSLTSTSEKPATGTSTTPKNRVSSNHIIEKSTESSASKSDSKNETGESRESTALEKLQNGELSESQSGADKDKKLTLWEKVKHEANHYWNGTKLLAIDVRVSIRLVSKMALGYELTRREHRQLKRTIADLARLIPFLPFVIIPFAELLLPVVIKVFPGILPSTFESAKAREDKGLRLRMKRKEVSDYVRATLKETGLPIPKASFEKEAFTTFFRKVHTTGESPTAEDVIAVCKIFRDDMTLDNLSRPQLVSICRYLNLSSFGTDIMLRFLIRSRMRQLKQDDKIIAFEGVEQLTVSELQAACAGRGIRTWGVSPSHLRDALQTWLTLRLDKKVPSTMLMLSNAYMYSQGKDHLDQMEALTNVLSSISPELIHETQLEMQDSDATNAERLAVLKEQEELIEEENEQAEEQGQGSVPRDDQDIDDSEDRMSKAQAAGDNPAQVAEASEAEQEGKVSISSLSSLAGGTATAETDSKSHQTGGRAQNESQK